MTLRVLLLLLLLCCVCWLTQETMAKNIVFLPFPSTSRTMIHANIARRLVAKGHAVTLVVSDRILNKRVLDDTGITVVVYHTTLDMERDFLDEKVRQHIEDDPRNDVLLEITRSVAHELLGNQSLFQDMTAARPHLFVFDESAVLSKMFAVFPYRMDVPFAYMDIYFRPLSQRIPFLPAVEPLHVPTLGREMTFLQRLQNTLAFVGHEMYRPYLMEDVVARYVPDKPYVSLSDLNAMAEVWLMETNPIMDLPYPTLPNVKHIGVVMTSDPPPLDPKYQTFMDSAEHGVVVVSFGSVIINFPERITNTLMTAFLKLSPVKVVFRTDANSPDPKQILTSHWLPQNSLLAHPNCRVLVGHGGMNGNHEALYHAVPMLNLPLVNDQPLNSRLMQARGMGLSRDIRKITADELVAAVTELIQNSRYADRVREASALYRELYPDAGESAAYWLDHVLRHGGGYMRSAGQEIPLYKFLLVDVVLVLLLSVLAALCFLCCCLCWIVRKLCANKEKRD